MIVNNRGEKLDYSLEKSENPKAVILQLHGFMSGKDLLFHGRLRKELAEAGYTTLSLSFSGYGKSEGKFEDTTLTKHEEDAKAAIKFLEQYKLPIHIIGHSMGAAIALRIATEIKVKSIVMIGPPLKSKPESKVEIAERNIKNGYAELVNYKGEKTKLKEEFFIEKNKWKPLEDCKNIKSAALTIIGTEEKNVEVKTAIEGHKLITTNKKFVLIEGEDHYFRKETTRMIQEIIEWLDQL